MQEKSVQRLRQAASLAPDNPQVLYRVAEGYELLHRRDDALKWILKVLETGISPQTIERNAELAVLGADRRFPRKNPET
jgi:hypothetical protein